MTGSFLAGIMVGIFFMCQSQMQPNPYSSVPFGIGYPWGPSFPQHEGHWGKWGASGVFIPLADL